jgi:hypothetical protein
MAVRWPAGLLSADLMLRVTMLRVTMLRVTMLRVTLAVAARPARRVRPVPVIQGVSGPAVRQLPVARVPAGHGQVAQRLFRRRGGRGDRVPSSGRAARRRVPLPRAARQHAPLQHVPGRDFITR